MKRVLYFGWFVMSGWAAYTLVAEIAAARRWAEAGHPLP